MRRLFALISSDGKSKEQLTDELWQAFRKYDDTEKKVVDDLEVDLTEQEQGTGYQILGTRIPSDKDEK